MQTDRCRLGKRLGAGVYGEVYDYTTPLYPNAVLKSGKQGDLFPEADRMWRMRHPNIARVLAKVLPYGTARDPNQPGYIAVEELGKPLREYDATRSAVIPSNHSCCMGL